MARNRHRAHAPLPANLAKSPYEGSLGQGAIYFTPCPHKPDDKIEVRRLPHDQATYSQKSGFQMRWTSCHFLRFVALTTPHSASMFSLSASDTTHFSCAISHCCSHCIARVGFSKLLVLGKQEQNADLTTPFACLVLSTVLAAFLAGWY